jgi:hypothetical protein
MARIVSNRGITKHLVELGLVPDRCITADLQFRVDGAVVIAYEVFVTDDDLEKLREAINRTLAPSEQQS